MLDEQSLQQVVERIVAAARPRRIILFGSYGRGEADTDSDLDITVIQSQVPNRYEEMIRLRKAIGNVGIGVDVLVYSEVEYERRSQVPGTVLYWARKEGRCMKPHLEEAWRLLRLADRDLTAFDILRAKSPSLYHVLSRTTSRGKILEGGPILAPD